MMSVMLEPQNSMVASVAIVLVLGGFFNGVEPRLRTQTPFMKNVFGEPDLPSYHRALCPQSAAANSTSSFWTHLYGMEALAYVAITLVLGDSFFGMEPHPP